MSMGTAFGTLQCHGPAWAAESEGEQSGYLSRDHSI
jgi:hypothetical protein